MARACGRPDISPSNQRKAFTAAKCVPSGHQKMACPNISSPASAAEIAEKWREIEEVGEARQSISPEVTERTSETRS